MGLFKKDKLEKETEEVSEIKEQSGLKSPSPDAHPKSQRKDRGSQGSDASRSRTRH